MRPTTGMPSRPCGEDQLACFPGPRLAAHGAGATDGNRSAAVRSAAVRAVPGRTLVKVWAVSVIAEWLSCPAPPSGPYLPPNW